MGELVWVGGRMGELVALPMRSLCTRKVWRDSGSEASKISRWWEDEGTGMGRWEDEGTGIIWVGCYPAPDSEDSLQLISIGTGASFDVT